jgi:hypothetical protein
MEWHEFWVERLKTNLEFQGKNMDKYKGKFVRPHDLIQYSRSRFGSQYSNGLMGMQRLAVVNTDEGKALYEKYEKMFEKGLREYEKRASYKIFPLSEQVKIQTAMILAGLLIV